MRRGLKTFPCTACGKCCKNVDKSAETAFLDRGDGTCKHFDEKTNLCSIYESRPLVCRVDQYYKTYLSQVYTWEEFVKMNIEICNRL